MNPSMHVSVHLYDDTHVEAQWKHGFGTIHLGVGLVLFVSDETVLGELAQAIDVLSKGFAKMA